MKTFEDLLENIKKYNNNHESINRIIKAYLLACELHSGIFRESGDPYIVHPINVAYTLSTWLADEETIIASLLHDTLEDTEITKGEITKIFGSDVSNLVDGVTKISKLNFVNEETCIATNTRKLLTALTDDIRIILIKLADRLDNMRTLQYKKASKQVENAKETLELYVRLAYNLGIYSVKNELEDLSFKYLLPLNYERTKNEVERYLNEVNPIIDALEEILTSNISNENIPYRIVRKNKGLYGIYRSIQENIKIEDIHDLIGFRIITEDVNKMYDILRIVHRECIPLSNYFKDYTYHPKTNMYRSIHTTIFTSSNNLVQIRLRTKEMNDVSSLGILYYYRFSDAQKLMNYIVRSNYGFIKCINDLDTLIEDNQEFLSNIKQELDGNVVFVRTIEGIGKTLPKGSTPVDLAIRLDPFKGCHLMKADVNGKAVNLDYQLRSNDVIRLYYHKNHQLPDLVEKAGTTYVKRLIREYK